MTPGAECANCHHRYGLQFERGVYLCRFCLIDEQIAGVLDDPRRPAPPSAS